jgi:putative effector of murein hydrolase
VAATAAARPSTTQAITTPLAMVVTIRVARVRRIGVVATVIAGQATTTVSMGIESLHQIQKSLSYAGNWGKRLRFTACGPAPRFCRIRRVEQR